MSSLICECFECIIVDDMIFDLFELEESDKSSSSSSFLLDEFGDPGVA